MRNLLGFIKFFKIPLIFLLIGCVMLYNKKSDHYLKDRVVLIKDEHGLCSGEQIKAPSGVNYILTASHCAGLRDKDNNFSVTTESGVTLKRKLIAEDPNSDLLLIEGLPNISGIDIASSLKTEEEIRTFTHGMGLKTYRTIGTYIITQKSQVQVVPEACESGYPKYRSIDIPTFFGLFRFCIMETQQEVVTAMIVPGSSGGMVVNSSGDLVGVVSAGDGHFGFLVSIDDIHNFMSGY